MSVFIRRFSIVLCVLLGCFNSAPAQGSELKKLLSESNPWIKGLIEAADEAQEDVEDARRGVTCKSMRSELVPLQNATLFLERSFRAADDLLEVLLKERLNGKAGEVDLNYERICGDDLLKIRRYAGELKFYSDTFRAEAEGLIKFSPIVLDEGKMPASKANRGPLAKACIAWNDKIDKAKAAVGKRTSPIPDPEFTDFYVRRQLEFMILTFTRSAQKVYRQLDAYISLKNSLERKIARRCAPLKSDVADGEVKPLLQEQ